MSRALEGQVTRRAARLAGAASVVPLLLLLYAAAGAQGRFVLLSVDLPDSPSAGLQIFGQKRCIRCHSLAGSGGTVGPDLTRIELTDTALDLAVSFWNHAPAMRQRMAVLGVTPPTMTTGEVTDLLALLTVYRPWMDDARETGRPESGRGVFVTKGCAACHDADKPTWKKLGPNLEKYRGSASGTLIAQGMWNHSSEMATAMRRRDVPWPQISRSEMSDLLAYLQSGTTSPATQSVYYEPGSPRRGRELFSEKRCGACHTIAGVGGSGGPELAFRPPAVAGSAAAIAASMWNHGQTMAAEFRRRGIAQVRFSGREMTDIIAYLRFVNYANVRGDATRGSLVFTNSCSACHTAGAGAKVGPDLAKAANLDTPMAMIAAMWNHAGRMNAEAERQGMSWPRLQRGDAADLAAFFVTRRAPRS